MFNKFDQFNLKHGVDANRANMLKYMLKLGIEWWKRHEDQVRKMVTEYVYAGTNYISGRVY